MQGITATTSYGARVHGNRMTGLARSGPYHDLGLGPTRDLSSYYNLAHRCYQCQASNIESATRDYEAWNSIHDNIMDLEPPQPESWNHPVPAGLLLWLANGAVPGVFAFGVVVVRDNHIRFAGGVQGPGTFDGYTQIGIDTRNAREAIVQDNVIAFPVAAEPLKHQYCGTALFERNLSGTFQEMVAVNKTPVP